MAEQVIAMTTQGPLSQVEELQWELLSVPNSRGETTQRRHRQAAQTNRIPD